MKKLAKGKVATKTDYLGKNKQSFFYNYKKQSDDTPSPTFTKQIISSRNSVANTIDFKSDETNSTMLPKDYRVKSNSKDKNQTGSQIQKKGVRLVNKILGKI